MLSFVECRHPDLRPSALICGQIFALLAFFAAMAFAWSAWFAVPIASLQSLSAGAQFWLIGMKAKTNGHRVELGRHIVADPQICGGQPTFKGTRIMVWIVLEQLEDGMTWDEIMGEWRGKVSKAAIAEAIAISDLVVKHEPFKGFHVRV